MIKTLIFIFILLINLSGFTQDHDTINQYDENGLKIGYWKLDQIFQGEELSCEGRFIVIPIDKSVDYSKDFDGIVFIHFDKNNYTFEYSDKTDELISVKDGEWISYRKFPEENNEVALIEYFNKGYCYKRRVIPPINNLELYSDYTRIKVLTDSTKRWDTYLGDDSVVYYSYNEKTKYTFYPNNKLELKDNLLRLRCISSNPDTVYLRFRARENVNIDSVSTQNKSLDFFHPTNKNQIQYKLKTNQEDSIGVIYKPDKTNKTNKITKSSFILHGTDCDYKVFLWLLTNNDKLPPAPERFHPADSKQLTVKYSHPCCGVGLLYDQFKTYPFQFNIVSKFDCA